MEKRDSGWIVRKLVITLGIMAAIVLLLVVYSIVRAAYMYHIWSISYHRPEDVAARLRTYAAINNRLPDSLIPVFDGLVPTYHGWGDNAPYEYRKLTIRGKEYAFAVTTPPWSVSKKLKVTVERLTAAALTGKSVVEYDDMIVIVVTRTRRGWR